MVHKIPDACGFKSSTSFIESVKIVGNMMELNNHTAKMLHMEISPTVFIEVIISSRAPMAKKESTFDGAIILVK